ncbi:MAG: CDP-glucose 4,6-dehydratase [Myxococcota bacterium]
MTPEYWDGRRVLVTGHTGFKGSWLCSWLVGLGARVTGVALDVPTSPSLFESVRLASRLRDLRADVRDLQTLRGIIALARPEVVLHLAAQPLVRRSYAVPEETFATNVMGVVNLLEAVRERGRPCSIVVVTSDKCYENRGERRSFREDDPLGGDDPYSASKACAEIVAAAYRRSFLRSEGIALATGRAGNVIGGGDWAADRLVPDLIRALVDGRPARVRSPEAVRPWQHVLEPLHGYLTLAERLASDGERFARAWNFGPAPDSERSVGEIADRIVELWGPHASWERARQDAPAPREASFLSLDAGRSRRELGWTPGWSIDRTLARTVAWYRAWQADRDLEALVREQIEAYQAERRDRSRPAGVALETVPS